MNVALLGSQISKFRKDLGMTQEELGRAVGVSTQAVSRWECGGAPDVSLLPAIADTLHVTVDALFGREGGEIPDIRDALLRYLASLPAGGFYQELVRLVWETAIPCAFAPELGRLDIGPIERCELSYQGSTTLAKSVVSQDAGLLMGACAGDLSFMLVFPEPEAGYRHFFAENEQYRGLFGVLARPRALELLLTIAAENTRFVSTAFLAKRTGAPRDEVEQVMEALAENHVVERTEMELEDGRISAWSMGRVHMLAPLLLFARYLCQNGEFNHVGGFSRNKPWLRDTEEKEVGGHEG